MELIGLMLGYYIILYVLLLYMTIFLNIKNLVLHITLNKEYSLLIYGAKKILFILLVYI